MAGLGEEYAIAENYFKPYPTCRFTHPALDALEEILREKKISPEEIARVSVTSFKAAVHTASKPPANVEAMRFSVPYLIAARLSRGPINLATLDHDIVHDPQVRDLAGRVEMSLSQEYEQMRPGRNPSKVTLHLKDGHELTREVMDCLGDPLKPMPREDLVPKFLDLAGPVIGRKQAEDSFSKKCRGWNPWRTSDLSCACCGRERREREPLWRLNSKHSKRENSDQQDEILKRIGTKIRNERNRLGLSLEALARKVGISKMTLHRIETGMTSPSVITLTEISFHLKKPIESLIREGDPKVVLIKKAEQDDIMDPESGIRVLAPRGLITRTGSP